MNARFLSRTPRWRVALWAGGLLALALPGLLMALTEEVVWTGFDFLVFGLMLAVVCGGIELAMRLSSQRSYRLAALLTLGGGFLMVWANLAVGIIGNEENPRNLLFYLVLLVGIAGAMLTRFDARGLSRTLRLMAASQLLVAVVAALLGWALLPVFTAFFVVLWLVAGQLFNNAARQQRPA
jgi:hypothetical protein